MWAKCIFRLHQVAIPIRSVLDELDETVAMENENNPTQTTLRSRNVMLDRQRTSMRLEPEMWEALSEIAAIERTSVNSLITRIQERRRQSSLTSSVRVFVMTYFRHTSRVDRGDAEPKPIEELIEGS